MAFLKSLVLFVLLPIPVLILPFHSSLRKERDVLRMTDSHGLKLHSLPHTDHGPGDVSYCYRVVTALVKHQLTYSHLLPDAVRPVLAHPSGEVKAPPFHLLQSNQDQPKLKAILNI